MSANDGFTWSETVTVSSAVSSNNAIKNTDNQKNR